VNNNYPLHADTSWRVKQKGKMNYILGGAQIYKCLLCYTNLLKCALLQFILREEEEYGSLSAQRGSFTNLMSKEHFSKMIGFLTLFKLTFSVYMVRKELCSSGET